MLPTMNEQIVLVTGAKGGLGKSVTTAFLDSGASVAGSSRSISENDFPHPRFLAIPADLLDPEQAAHLVQTAVERCGRIDALVHLAGGFTGGALHDTSDAVWDEMMNANLRAAFHVFRAVVPAMRNAGRGRVVAIASRLAVETAPGAAAYAASKAALVSLVRSVALENRDAGITANAILPGTIDTAKNRSWGSPEERAKWVSPDRIADLAVFLVSDAAAEITGAAIPVYGGAA
jgi:NAD(P)-dependent dehydrogenase (short-subunit alcohol dehydrogenase family)